MPSKDKVTFTVSFTGEYLKIGKEIKKDFDKLKGKKGVGRTSPLSDMLREGLIDLWKAYRARIGKPVDMELRVESDLTEPPHTVYESIDVSIVDQQRDPVKEGLDEYCYYIKGLGWYSSIKRPNLNLSSKGGIKGYIPDPIIIEHERIRQREKAFRASLDLEDKEKLSKQIEDSLVILHSQRLINDPKLKDQAQSMIEKRTYGQMQKEVRYYENQVKERDDRIWQLQEELAGLKNVDFEEQLRAERQKNTDLETQLRYSKTKIDELESETHQLQTYKNEAFNLRQQIRDLNKQLATKVEPQVIEKEVIREVSVKDPEEQKRIRDLQEEINKLKDNLILCYDTSGGEPKAFQRLFRQTFPNLMPEYE